MSDAAGLLILLPVLAFAFMNGANDSGTMAAAVVGSRCMSPRAAVLLAAAAAFAGAALLGSAVARTLGAGLVHLDLLPPSERTYDACVAAAFASILWGTAAWRLGLPGSYTHALLGGWLGAFGALGGPSVVRWGNALLVLAGVLLTPVLGLLVSWGAMGLVNRAAGDLTMQAKGVLRGLERALFFLLSLAHGANAAQKSMALLFLAGLSLRREGGWPAVFEVPLWIRTLCSAAFCLGVLFGFTQPLKTVGFGIFRVQTLHSLCALGSSGGLILLSTLAGLPLSAGQINSSAVLGAGAGRSVRRVRWDVAADIAANWALTFPVSALLAYLTVKLIE